MGIIQKIAEGIDQIVEPEPEPEPEEEPETEDEKRRRIQAALFNSDEKDGFVYRGRW